MVQPRVVPELLQWTEWKMDSHWFQLCSEVRAKKHRIPFAQQSKPMKLASILIQGVHKYFCANSARDWVGSGAARMDGMTAQETNLLCRRVMKLAATNALTLTLDPQTGELVDVSGY